MVNRHYFGTDGIRGRANQMPMTVDVALNLGKALGAVLPRCGVESVDRQRYASIGIYV